MNYEKYQLIKQEWEAGGGYRNLPTLLDAGFLTHSLHDRGYSVVIYTARPVTLFKRIRHDTFYWLTENRVHFDELRFGGEERVGYACQLMAEGTSVVLVDDNPTTVERAMRSGIRTICPARPYNQRISNFDGDGDLLIEEIAREMK